MHAGVERERAVWGAIDQVVDVALHRPDMVLEARVPVRKACIHETAISADARRMRKTERRFVEAFAATFRHWHGHQLAVGVEGPAVIAAGQSLRVAFAFVDHLGAAVGAAVEQHLHRAVAVARHDDRLAAEIRGDEVTRIGHLALVTDEQPGAAEDALHLQLEHIRIGIDAPMHPAGFDQRRDVVSVSIAVAHDDDPDASSWPGSTRPSTSLLAKTKDVGARHKAGHDGTNPTTPPPGARSSAPER